MSGSGLHSYFLFLAGFFLSPAVAVDVVVSALLQLFRRVPFARAFSRVRLFLGVFSSVSDYVDVHGLTAKRFVIGVYRYSSACAASLHACRAVCRSGMYLSVLGPSRGLLPHFKGGLGGL